MAMKIIHRWQLQADPDAREAGLYRRYMPETGFPKLYKTRKAALADRAHRAHLHTYGIGYADLLKVAEVLAMRERFGTRLRQGLQAARREENQVANLGVLTLLGCVILVLSALVTIPAVLFFGFVPTAAGVAMTLGFGFALIGCDTIAFLGCVHDHMPPVVERTYTAENLFELATSDA